MRGNKYQATKRCYQTEVVETSDKINECNSSYVNPILLVTSDDERHKKQTHT